MAQKFRKVDPRIWTDEEFSQLSPTDKLVVLYILTAQANRIGMFVFKMGACADDTGIPPEACRACVERVCVSLGWEYDPAARVIFLPNWWKYNPPRQPQNLTGAEGALADLHDLPKTEMFESWFGNLLSFMESWGWSESIAEIPNVLQITSFPIADPKPPPKPRLSPGLARPKPPTQEKEKEQEQEQEKEQEKEKETISSATQTPPPVGGDMQAVVDYWNSNSGTKPVRKLTRDRQRKLGLRLRDCDWPWRDAIDKVPIPNTEAFTWQPDFDYLIANDSNAYKLAEGKFDKVKKRSSVDSYMDQFRTENE